MSDHTDHARQRVRDAMARNCKVPRRSDTALENRSDADETIRPGDNGYAHHAEPPPTIQPPPAYVSFPLETLPEPVRGYVDASARAIGIDPAFVAVPILCTLAGAIGNTRRLKLKKSWEEPAILWAAIVGESGTQKSPAIDAAKKFPRRRQQLARRRFEEQAAAYEIELARYEKEYAAWKCTKGERDPPEKPAAPICDRCLVDDTTVEALAPILLGNWRGVAIIKDELAGWLGAFDKYSAKGKQGADCAKWLEMFGGRAIVIDRKTGIPPTIYVPMASVTVTGGIQPGILRRAIGQEHRDNGLLARLLLAWPPRRPKRWTECDVDPALVKTMGETYDRLFELAPTKDEDGELTPVLVTMTPEAKALFVTFANAHGAEQMELEGDLAAAWSKLEGYAARLALVHHLTRWAANEVDDDGILDATSMAAGIELSRWFAAEARRVYGALEETEEDEDLHNLLKLIQTNDGEMTARELAHRSRKYRGCGAAEDALEALVKKGAGHWKNVATGGRSARVFRLGNAR